MVQKKLRTSAGFQNQICVRDSVRCSDQSDGLGHSLFECQVRFVEYRHAGQCRGKRCLGCGGVYGEEFFGHNNLGHDEIPVQCLKNVEDARYVVDQRNVDGLELRPIGKSTIGNDQRVRMPDTADKRVDGGIKDACLEHATRVTAIRSDQAELVSSAEGSDVLYQGTTLVGPLRFSEIRALAPEDPGDE
jgi:hypothetical protein